MLIPPFMLGVLHLGSDTEFARHGTRCPFSVKIHRKNISWVYWKRNRLKEELKLSENDDLNDR